MHFIPRQADLIPQARSQHLPAENADGSRNRARLRNNFIGGHRHKIAARAGQISHGNDHRLARLVRVDHFSPDRIGGDIRSAGAIHAEEDGLDIFVLRGRANGGGHRV